MLISIILSIVAIVYLAVTIVWSLLFRRLSKTRVRLIGIVASLVLAIVGTVVLKSTVFTASNLPWIGAKLSPELMELLMQSPTLCEVVMGCVSALVTPILLLAFFLVFSFVSWIVFLLISLIFGAKMKEKDAVAPYAKTRTVVLAVAQALIVLVVWIVPISVYSEIVPVAANAVSEAKTLDESTQQTVDSVVNDYIAPINDNVLLNVFRTFGVSALSDTMTGFQVNGQPASLENEVQSIAYLVCNVMPLTQVDFAEYDEKEAVAILNIVDSFERSEMMPAIAGELIYNATDAWKNDQPFIGVWKDVLYIAPNGMFDDFANSLIDILHTDSQNTDALCADLSSVADVFVIMIRGDVLANIADQEQLVSILSKEGLVNSMITELGENPSLKELIPEVTNIGIRAIATTLGINESAEEAYNEMLDSIAAELNAVKDLSAEDQVAALTQTLNGTFEDAGMIVDEEILEFYSGSMIDSLLAEPNGQSIDAEDVKAFFAVYAWSTAEYSDVLEQGVSGQDSTTALAGKDAGFVVLQQLLVGTVFEGMSAEDLHNNGASVLARITVQLSELEETDSQVFAEQAKQIVRNEYSAVLGAQSALLNQMLEVNITKPISKGSVTNTASMQNAATMKEKTVLVTLEDLLVDSKSAAKDINADTLVAEAAAIESIFGTASSLLKKTADGGEMKLDEVAGMVGSILDDLSKTSAYGKTDDSNKNKTSYLFVAVLQSKQVREAAGVDMSTATQLGEKGSTGDNINYSQTFNNISATITIIGNADSGELSDEEIEEMIRNINPQSAGMIEVYVTPDRLTEQYEVPEKYSVTAAPLISNIFGFMASEPMDDVQYAAESKAINNILTLTMAARDNATDSKHNKHLFKENDNDTESVLTTDAYGTVATLMASRAVADSLRKTDYEADPFELSDMMHEDETRDEAQELKDAIGEYYQDNKTDENKETLSLIGMLFGFDATEMNEILAA